MCFLLTNSDFDLPCIIQRLPIFAERFKPSMQLRISFNTRDFKIGSEPTKLILEPHFGNSLTTSVPGIPLSPGT